MWYLYLNLSWSTTNHNYSCINSTQITQEKHANIVCTQKEKKQLALIHSLRIMFYYNINEKSFTTQSIYDIFKSEKISQQNHNDNLIYVSSGKAKTRFSSAQLFGSCSCCSFKL